MPEKPKQFQIENPFPKKAKCEFPGCIERQEAIMCLVRLCGIHYKKIFHYPKEKRPYRTTKEIKQLMKEMRIHEINPLQKYL